MSSQHCDPCQICHSVQEWKLKQMKCSAKIKHVCLRIWCEPYIRALLHMRVLLCSDPSVPIPCEDIQSSEHLAQGDFDRSQVPVFYWPLNEPELYLQRRDMKRSCWTLRTPPALWGQIALYLQIEIKRPARSSCGTWEGFPDLELVGFPDPAVNILPDRCAFLDRKRNAESLMVIARLMFHSSNWLHWLSHHMISSQRTLHNTTRDTQSEGVWVVLNHKAL